MISKKKYLIICIMLIALLGLGTTFAWYTWSTSEDEETKIVTNLGAATVYYEAGSDIEGVRLLPTATKEEGISKTITVKAKKDTAYKLSFNLYLDINTLPEGLKNTSFKYELYKIGTEDAIASGDFSQTSLDANLTGCTTNDTNHIVLVNDEAITTTTMTYVLYIWIDGNMDNPNTMQGQRFNFKLHADGQNAVLGETMVQHITSLYENAEKTEVEHSGEHLTYNYTSSDIGLMSDKVVTVISTSYNDDGNNKKNNTPQTISYLISDTLEYDILPGNIRYYGVDPNNYIDIGDVYDEDITVNNWEIIANMMGSFLGSLITSEDTCKELFSSTCSSDTECEEELKNNFNRLGFASLDEACGTVTYSKGTRKKLYRIVGVFKNVNVILDDGSVVKQDLIKVIRVGNIGEFSFDYKYDGSITSFNGDWSTATINQLLNHGYYGSTTFNYYNNTTSVKEYNFAATGLSERARDKVASVIWNIGGTTQTSSNVYYPNVIYKEERGTSVLENRSYIWNGNVALLYPSDAAYAVDFNNCSQFINKYNTSGCQHDSNWITSFSSQNGMWFITPDNNYSYYSWGSNSDGAIVKNSVGSLKGIVPTFYLKADTVYVSGSGTYDDPYVAS